MLLFTPAALALVFSAAACGSEHAGSGSSAPPPKDTVAPSASSANHLTVSYRASAQAPAKTWTLTCDPTGGDHPKAAQACASLAKTPDAFKPVPPDMMCTKIYGGPEIATVKGTWHGRPVDTEFTRVDGCQLARWHKVAPLFGDVPPVR
ncbi:SSI family serine proteinase inhibitor [Actinomadura gamaensis]|uniref:SSI family serine proteinase inhibitor n=1 Tax=Actinomadura gamaensis TaxID=1763541 RepID=A0ABV9TZT5_9ACTN